MNIKSLLLGSAAALAAVSGAQAADAIVAAEPEPMEYVRVCDAFGTGYFYIPGTETCLKIGGYVRVQADARSDFDLVAGQAGQNGYRTNTRGKLQISAKSDTELGTLSSIINMEANTNGSGDAFVLKDTFIELGGFRVGYFFNYFDTGLPGETVLTDASPAGVFGGGFGGNTLNNSVRYTFDGGAFQAYIQADAFNSEDGWKTDGYVDPITGDYVFSNDGEVGVNGVIAAKLGAVAIDFFAGYDFGTEDAAFASTLSAEIGPGKLGVFAAYATGANSYYDASEWTIGAEYAIAVTDKLSITPGVQYWDNIVYALGDFQGGDAWRAGVTADYKITDGLTAKATVNYTDVDAGAIGSGDRWDGFFRLQRSF